MDEAKGYGVSALTEYSWRKAKGNWRLVQQLNFFTTQESFNSTQYTILSVFSENKGDHIIPLCIMTEQAGSDGGGMDNGYYYCYRKSHYCMYCSVPGKCPWVLEHNLQLWPA